MKILGIIPSRYGSSRFPGKPLVVINGKSMIRRVYEQSLKCPALTTVVVATDHEAIRNHVLSFGGKVVMTGTHHLTGTERCMEVVEKLEIEGDTYDFVVNIQGDEPYIAPEQISQVVECLKNTQFPLATLIKKITNAMELEDPNVVKVVTGASGQALYFSRSAIPFRRGLEKQAWLMDTSFFKHIGIYGYQTEVLRKIVGLPAFRLELAESLEQLRWLGHGYQIQTQETDYENIAIDTPADILKIPSGL
jgi:3-deoxy-manno-octulosonate cytidylyltransferase (CMP-KDO synthetase)